MILKINVLLFAAFSLLYSLSCTNSRKLSNPYDALNVKATTTFQDPAGRWLNFDMEFDVFYSGSYTIYDIKQHFDSIYNDRVLLSEERSTFFLFHEDSVYGIFYNPSFDTAYRYSVDSILTTSAFRNIKLEPTARLHKTASIMNPKTKELIEVYLDTNGHHKDSFTYYFNKDLMNARFSFSRSLDSLKGMKFYKFRNAFDSAHQKEFGVKGTSFLLSELKVQDPEKIRRLFDWYRNKNYLSKM